MTQSSMGHGSPMVSMTLKKHIYILLHYESSTLYIPEFHSEFNGHFPMVSHKIFTAMAAFRAGEASWLMMCWATTEATPFVELSFSWKDTILGAPMGKTPEKP